MKHMIFVIRWPVSGIRNYIKYTFNNDVFKEYRFSIVAPDLDFSDFVEKHLDSRFTLVPCNGDAKSMMKALVRECRKYPSARIHAHGFTAIVYSILPALICRRKLIGTAHDNFTPKQFPGKFGFIKKILLTLALNYPSAVITVSEDCKSNILRYLPLVSGRKLIPVLNGIDAEYFAKAEPRYLKRELGLDDDTLLVGFLGRFSAQKGFQYIIEAVQILDKTDKARKLKLVCFGWGGFIREEQEIIAKLGLKSYFIFHPYVEDVAAVIKGLDLVLMPSLWEACGLLAMEVLACGTSLVVSDCEGLREVAAGTPASVVKIRDSESLAEVLMEFLECDLEKVKKKFVDYAEIAQSRYCVIRNAAPQTLSIYEEYLDDK